LATDRPLGYFAREGIQRYEEAVRRYSGCSRWKYLSTALYLLSGSADAGCWAFLQRRSRSKIAFLFGELGLVVLSLGLLVESWVVEICIRICLSSRLLHSILISPLSQYSSRRLPLVVRVCINLCSSPSSPLKVLAVLRRGHWGYSSASSYGVRLEF
jgi:hypothetical protein